MNYLQSNQTRKKGSYSLLAIDILYCYASQPAVSNPHVTRDGKKMTRYNFFFLKKKTIYISYYISDFSVRHFQL